MQGMLLQPTKVREPEGVQVPTRRQELEESLRFARQREAALWGQLKAEREHIASLERKLRRAGGK